MKEPYRVAPPRPLNEDDIPPPKPRKPIPNRVKGALCVTVALGMAYGGAYAKDQGVLHAPMSAVLDLTFFIGFITMVVLFGAGIVTLVAGGPRDE